MWFYKKRKLRKRLFVAKIRREIWKLGSVELIQYLNFHAKNCFPRAIAKNRHVSFFLPTVHIANIVGDEIIGKTIVWRVILSRFDRKCHGRTMFMGHTWRRFYSVMKTIDNTWSWFWKWSSDFCFLTLVNTSGRTTRKWEINRSLNLFVEDGGVHQQKFDD